MYMFSFSINTCVHYNVQQMPSQQPTALMPTPTMQTQMTTPQMGGVGMGGAHGQYAPPPNMAPSGAGGGYPHQQPGVPMSAPSSNLMSAPATSAPPPSMYAGVVGHAPQQPLLQTKTTPVVAPSGGISGVPMAMTMGVASVGGVVTSQPPSSSGTAVTTASSEMPATGVSNGVGGATSVDPNQATEKKKKKKKVSSHGVNSCTAELYMKLEI